jgi:hypothetical protein
MKLILRSVEQRLYFFQILPCVDASKSIASRRNLLFQPKKTLTPDENFLSAFSAFMAAASP